MKIQALVLLVGFTTLVHAAGQETIPGIVKRQAGKVEFLVRDADLIARVVVMDDGIPRLSRDQLSSAITSPQQ